MRNNFVCRAEHKGSDVLEMYDTERLGAVYDMDAFAARKMLGSELPRAWME